MGNCQKAQPVQPIQDTHEKPPDYYDKWYHGGGETRTNKTTEYNNSYQTRIRDIDTSLGWIIRSRCSFNLILKLFNFFY